MQYRSSSTMPATPRGSELIDVSARQFDPQEDQVRRGPVQDELDRWECVEEADPDAPDAWGGGFLKLKAIHPDWRGLRDVGPPGSLPDWPARED